jgi:hypothetical protein
VRKELKASTLETAFEDAWFPSHSFHGTAEFAAQMGDIDATHVAQLNAFELLPEPLARIQFRGIGRQTLHMQPLCCPIREELSDGMATVDGSAIPDDDHAAGDLAQDGCLPHRRIGAHHTGQRIEARFVYEEEALLLTLRPFLMADQVSSRQWVMAASSR